MAHCGHSIGSRNAERAARTGAWTRVSARPRVSRSPPLCPHRLILAAVQVPSPVTSACLRGIFTFEVSGKTNMINSNNTQSHPNVLPFPPQPMAEESSGLEHTASGQYESGLRLLITRLDGEPPGDLQDESGEIKRLLPLAWDDFTNSRQTKMSPTKLWRIESLHWAPPVLSFDIERHGAVVLGSSRAEIQRWTVNLDTRLASCESVGLRQIVPAAKGLNTQPLAEEIATLILNHVKDDRLKWISHTLVMVKIGLVIKATNARTTEGRRCRFRRDLENELQKAGWKPAKDRASNTYEKLD